MWEDSGQSGLLAGGHPSIGVCPETSPSGWRPLGGVASQWNEERQPLTDYLWEPVPDDQRAPMSNHLWPRTQFGWDDPSGPLAQGQGRGRRGLDEEPPACWEAPGGGRRVRSAPGRSRRRSRSFEFKSQEGQEIRQERKEVKEGEEGKRKEEKTEGQWQSRKTAWGQRLERGPGSKWLGSRPQEENKNVREGETSREKEEEGQEEGKRLLLRERREGRDFQQFKRPRVGRDRGVWTNQDFKEDLEKMPRSADGGVAGQHTGAAAQHSGAVVGDRPQGTSTSVPAVLSGECSAQDDAGDEKGGIASCILLGPGTSGQDPGTPRCPQPEVQSFRRTGFRQALDRDRSARAGPRRARSHSVGAGGRDGSKRGSGSWEVEGSSSEAVCDRMAKRQRGREQERRKRERQQREWQRKGLAQRSSTRRARTKKGGRWKSRQAEAEVEELRLSRQEKSGKDEWHMGEKESPDVSKVGLRTPGLGVDVVQNDVEVSASGFTDAFFESEEEKVGPSQEYPPGSRTEATADFLVEKYGALDGKKLVAVGDLLMNFMNDLSFDGFLHSKLQPTGKGSDLIFPLPWSSDIVRRSSAPAMVSATCRALNSLYGANDDAVKREPGESCLRALKYVVQCVESMESWNEFYPKIDFGIFFRSKGVDYRGEEVKIAQRVSWASLSPAIPPEVGGVDLVDFCTLGTKHYVENFGEFLVPPEKQWLGRPPAVMIEDCNWKEVCEGLVNCGICNIIPLEEVHHINGRALLGGLFGVGKGEYVGNLETQRLIMNFVPLNANCRPLDSDISTLPGISGLSPFMLEDGEIALISSEDIRCFFYLFRVPNHWYPYLGFNKEIPESMVPEKWKGKRCVLHACVLPMGFRNSVGIAQHVHRNVIRHALMKASPPITGEGEMRKDRPASQGREAFRIYLDNFDVISKVDPAMKEQLEGQPGLLSLVARQAYAEANLPRHPKKSVCQAARAEVQGAILDGELGIAYPKPPKVGIYVSLAIELLRRGAATQREMQVVCGGFVYFCLFRRPLLSALNAVWRFIEDCKSHPPVVRVPLPSAVKVELVRFVGLVPLARLDFRLCCLGPVTASDASSTGGGACVSTGLTSFGVAAANATVRGDLPEAHDLQQVLSIGLFDGVGCLRLACDLVGLPMAGHISVEKEASGRRVVEAAFADTIFVDDVAKVDEQMIAEWAGRFSQVGLILLGAGPPCQGVSGLNFDKRGALRDERSCLFQHVPRIRDLLKRGFPWAQVRTIMESVASMDAVDREIMSKAIGVHPFKVNASGITLAHRPRLYWCDWELLQMEGAMVTQQPDSSWETFGIIELEAKLDASLYLEAGWKLQSPEQRLPTFTTSRPASSPGRRPAGLERCTQGERQRWASDAHRFPPYQYRDHNCLLHKRTGELRIASLLEREVIMGMPAGYTTQCVPKTQRREPEFSDCRLSLVGNAWSVPVVAWLIGCLGQVLGLSPQLTPQKIVNAAAPGSSGDLQRLLQRPPIHRLQTVAPANGVGLVRKLAGLVSMKGEDLLLQASSEPQVKYQRLRASLPSRLWRWKTIAGWAWSGSPEHINVLELRAVFTTVRWWASQKKAHSARFVHLVDSLVCLHALSRGRSSSRKMRRTMAKLNSYLLVCNLHPVWAYVHTSDNPADRPSRRKVKKKWVK